MEIENCNFYSLSPEESLSLNLLLTLIFSNGLNSNQLNILGNFICALGQNILVVQTIIGALPDDSAIYQINQKSCLKDSERTETTQKQLINLQIELAQLKDKILRLEKELTFKKT
ncbi:hypothetical protein [Anaerosinus massiliensis]|uniref:hypothetical protein n=1 Tax=Massilibacillus massiliensis TaxID=1806837 RepID=UPI000DA63CAB|nr:hypothetical protein [Massilibacillus massiliensis]